MHPEAFASEVVADKPNTDALLAAMASLKTVQTQATDATESDAPDTVVEETATAYDSDAATSASISEYTPTDEELAAAEGSESDFSEQLETHSSADFLPTESLAEPVAPAANEQAAPSAVQDAEAAPAPLAQPEREPANMGLGLDTTGAQHALCPGVDVNALSALLPNGEKLVHEAQIDPWSHMISCIKPQSFMQVVMMHSAMQLDGTQMHLTVEPSQAHLLSDSLQQNIQTAVSQHLGQTIHVSMTVADVANTPMQLKQKIKAFRLEHSKQLFESDPSIQHLVSTFGASVKDGTLKPKP
jgi:hypothetical protein